MSEFTLTVTATHDEMDEFLSRNQRIISSVHGPTALAAKMVGAINAIGFVCMTCGTKRKCPQPPELPQPVNGRVSVCAACKPEGRRNLDGLQLLGNFGCTGSGGGWPLYYEEATGRYLAGCRNYSYEGALVHWGNERHWDPTRAKGMWVAVKEHHDSLNPVKAGDLVRILVGPKITGASSAPEGALLVVEKVLAPDDLHAGIYVIVTAQSGSIPTYWFKKDEFEVVKR